MQKILDFQKTVLPFANKGTRATPLEKVKSGEGLKIFLAAADNGWKIESLPRFIEHKKQTNHQNVSGVNLVVFEFRVVEKGHGRIVLHRFKEESEDRFVLAVPIIAV